MASDALAPAALPAEPSEDEYQTFCAALTASARGRAFLAEYARRHRGADTETLLAALARLETLMRAQARSGAEQQRAELRGLLGVIRAAGPELEQAALPARAAKLALLLGLLERRLQAMAEPEQAAAEAAQAARLALVASPDEPELPIPTPASGQPPALALAHERVPAPPPAEPSDSAAAIPEVSWFDSAPAAPVAAEIASTLMPPPVFEPQPPLPVVETAEASAPPPVEAVLPAPAAQEASTPEQAVSEATAPEPAPPVARDSQMLAETEMPAPAAPTGDNGWAPSAAKTAPPPPDPLAVLLALSEEERIALFT